MKTNREKQLVKNTIIVAIGKISTQFISFFLLPLYTAVLSTKEYGVVDILNTYISLLIPLLFLQIDQALFRNLIDVRNEQNEQKRIISTSFITVTAQTIFIILVFFIFQSFIKSEYKWFFIGNIIMAMYSNLFLQISRGQGDNFTYSLGSVVSGLGTIILNILTIVVLKWGAYGMLFSILSANLICSIFLYIRLSLNKLIRLKSFDITLLKELWKYSIPLVPNHLSWWIINASDRTIITYLLGLSVNGIYSAANKFSSVCVSFFSIFSLTWSESASLYIHDKDSSVFFSKIINDTIKLFTSLSYVIISIMPFVFGYLITGKDYSDAYFQIPILMIATIFNIVVSLFGSIYIAMKKSGEIAKTSIYSALINISINLLFINKIGLYAASISTLISYLSMSIYRYVDIKKYLRIKLDLKFIICSIIILPIILISYYLKNIISCGIIFIFVCIISLYFNFSIIKGIFLQLKNKNHYLHRGAN